MLLCLARKYLETNFSHEFRNNKNWERTTRKLENFLDMAAGISFDKQVLDVTPPIDVIHSAAGRDFHCSWQVIWKFVHKRFENSFIEAETTGVAVIAPEGGHFTDHGRNQREVGQLRPLTKELDNSLSKKKTIPLRPGSQKIKIIWEEKRGWGRNQLTIKTINSSLLEETIIGQNPMRNLAISHVLISQDYIMYITSHGE